MARFRLISYEKGDGGTNCWKHLSVFLMLVHLNIGHSANIATRIDMPNYKVFLDILFNFMGALPAQPPTTFCTSKECIRSASHLMLSMNLDVDPCENFYLYTCGKWIDQHPNCKDWDDFDGFDMIDQQVAKAESDVLEAMASATEPKALQKLRDMYKSCMDEDSRDILGIGAIYEHLENANLPIIPRYLYLSDEEKAKFTFDWMKSEALLKKSLSLDVAFGTIVHVNVMNSSESVIVMGSPETETPLPSPPTEPEDPNDSEKIKKRRIKVKTNVIKYILDKIIEDKKGKKPDEGRLQGAVDIILGMEEKLAEIARNNSDASENMEDLRSHTFKSLQDSTNALFTPPKNKQESFMFWKNYFNHLFNGTHVDFDARSDLIYALGMEMQYLSNVAAYVENTSDIEVELYYWWKAVFAMVINTSPEVVTYVTNQMNTLKGFTAEQETKKDHKECVALVSKHMGYALTYALMDKFYSKEIKPKVEIMINNMRKAFMSHVHDIEWMDEATKKVTIEKAEEIALNIGYPEWITQEGKLDEHYADVVIKRDAYLANIISTIRSYNMKKLGSLRKKPLRQWEARGFDENDAIVANAYYSPQQNAIDVPMVVLRYPLYRLGLELLNYGAVGAILGHEITHAFDNDGRKYDKAGNRRTWWTNATIDKFQDLTQCFVDHYENITLDGVIGQVNGTITVGENIADNGGLRAAFTAYHHYQDTFGVEPKLPGFENYSTNQMFFIAYTSAWCMELKSVVNIEDETDVHAPHYMRVLGTLQNSEDFSAAFNCPAGSFMNPTTKCNIW